MISIPLYSDDFVGRHEELAFLRDEFGIARRGNVRFVTIEGEAGLGKSRLAQQFLSAITPEAMVCTGYCSQDVRAPYLPFNEIFVRLDPRRAVAAAKLRERSSRGEEKAAYFNAVGEVFRRESGRKPLVAVIEDVQWADSATLDLLRFLSGHLDEARVLFVVTMRTDDVARNPALAALRSAASRNRSSALRLHPMRRNEIKHLVQGTLRRRELHLEPAVLSQIEVLAEGNPLFAEELVRVAVESGGLTLQRQMPLSLQAILSERLAPFSESERDILIRSAIVGQTFELPLLAAIGGCALDDALAVMQRAVAHGLLTEVFGEPLRFSFRHALIRQALADQLVLALAAPLHIRIAEELEGRLDARERAAELAYHWSAARVAQKARRWNEKAGDAAWSVFAYRDAIRFYSAALDWEYPPGPERAALYESLGTLLYIDGCGEEPARWFSKSCKEYEALGNAIGAAHALVLLADQYWVDAKTGESLRAASEAAAALQRLGHTQMFAQAMLSIARFSITLGNHAQARAHLRSVLRLRSHFDSGTRASLHEVRGETFAALGQTQAAVAELRTASRFAAQLGVSELIVQIENNFALAAADLGELDLAQERHGVALAEGHRTGMMWRIGYSALNYARTLTLRGELERARALVWEALETGVTTATFKTKAAAVGIPLALLVNDRALLEACADEDALVYAERSQEVQRIGSVAAAFADLRVSQGAPEEARRMLNRALRATAQAHRSWDLFVAVARWGSRDDVAVARTTLAAACGRPRVLRAYALLFGALTAGAADTHRSRRLAAVAAKHFAAMGDALHETFAIELAGRMEEASDRFRKMGAVRDVERLRSDRPRKPRALDLTARQAQIAELVALGETNRAIANRLHISEHTVEHHLSGIFDRLNLRSRSQLARLVAQGGARLEV